MYQCFHCGQNTVCWNSDFSFEDMGIIMECGDGTETEEGIVHICSCRNCGAEIEYRVPIYSTEIEENKKDVPEGTMTIYDYIEEEK